MDVLQIEACVAGRSNYSGTAPQCVARQEVQGALLIQQEEEQLALWAANCQIAEDL